MYEFIQTGELKVQAKRLLGYRIPLILVIIVNVVLILRVPMQPTGTAQADSLATHRELSETPAGDVSIDSPGITELTAEIAKVPAPSSGPADLNAGPGNGMRWHVAPSVPAATDAPGGNQVAVDALLAAPERGAAKLPDRSMIPIAAWRDNTQQVLQRSQQSGHIIRERYNNARHRVPETERTPAAESTPLAEQSHQPREEMWYEAGMTVRNPLENGETVRFLVDQRLCELQPGESHWFAPQQQWHVQFHRGGEFGDVDRVVTQGVYQFSATSQGWVLEPVDR